MLAESWLYQSTARSKYMKQIYAFKTVLIFLMALLVSSCASTPEQSNDDQHEVFYETMEDTQAAAVEALTALGFEVKKNEATYVEGYRPIKVNLSTRSGGETIGVWLKPVGKDKVDVKVSTAKSRISVVKQKTWDDELIAEMKGALL